MATPDSPLAEIIKTGKELTTAPNAPSDGVRAAMIIDNGCPIELIQFAKSD